jgi:hypothetical protein
MRTLHAAGLAGLLALAAACGGGGRDLQYGPPVPPDSNELAAATDAQTTLDASRTFAPGSEPTLGAPGLADQLVASLGGSPAPTASLPPATAARASAALGAAAALPASTVAIDPACVAITETSATWSGCVVTVSDVDPLTGDRTDMTVHVDGQLGWVPATGVTSWAIVETVDVAMTMDGQAVRLTATVRLEGALTLTASTVKGRTTSSVNATTTTQGFTMHQGVTTSLEADLAYAAEPFCLSGGTLTVEQVWTRRPAGMSAADLPNQGWRLEWTGCGQLTVAHGS